MLSIRFTVPGPVRGKGRPRTSVFRGHARIYTDAKTVRYEQTIRRHAHLAMKGVDQLTGAVALKMVARFKPTKSATKRDKAAMLLGDLMPTKKPDADNILKVIDALNKICFEDDAQIVSAAIIKTYAEEEGLDIEISEVKKRNLFANVEAEKALG